jgi:hypothetical protein
MLRRNVLGTGAAVLVLGVTGCGGSSQLSRADFVAQANKICKQASAAVQRSRGGVFTKVVAYEHQTTSQIGNLKPPSELKGSVSQFMRAQDALVAYVQQFQAAVNAKQSTKSLEKQGSTLQQQGAKLARELGLTDCHL